MKLFNKWIGLILCVSISFSACVGGIDVPTMNQERIDQAKQAISRELLVNKALRYTVMAGGAAAASYLIYQTWNNYYSVESKFDGKLYAPLGSWQWCERIFKITRDALISAALTKGVVTSGETMMEKLFHPGDIQWFIKSHTHLADTLKELRHFAYILDNAHQVSSMQLQYAKTSLSLSIKSLIAQMERLLGFIAYKIERIDSKADVAQSINEIPLFLKELVEQLLYAYESKLNNASINLSDRIIYFESELTNLVSRFAHLDEDIAWINEDLNRK